jgi:hypothetical protein
VTPIWKRSIFRIRQKQRNNIKTVHIKMWFEAVDWINLAIREYFVEMIKTFPVQ